MDIFTNIGFVFGWMGVICCIFAFIFLTLKAQEQIIKIKKNTDNENEHFKQDTIFLLLNSFGCTICTFIYCVYYGTIGSDPKRFNIPITQNICQYTSQYMANAGWQLSRYFFYNFMLWRIKASFREPQSLKLSKTTFIICLILIHLWLLFALCISIFFTPRKLMPNGECGIAIHDIFKNFTTSHIRTIAWAFDFGLTIFLLFLFLKRLFQLTQQDERINKFKRKTIILGVCATLTSIIMALVINFMVTKEWRYFIPLDLIVNLSCVLFTYTFSLPRMCPNCTNKINKFKNNQSNDENHKHEFVKQESTFSPQPNDSQVFNMLIAKAQENCINTHQTDAMPITSDDDPTPTHTRTTSTGSTGKEIEIEIQMI